MTSISKSAKASNFQKMSANSSTTLISEVTIHIISVHGIRLGMIGFNTVF